MSVEKELVSGGFAWDQKGPVYVPYPPKPQKPSKCTPEQRERWRRAKAKQRDKWIAMGIIKPRAEYLAQFKKRA